MNANTHEQRAMYFGIEVEVLAAMDHCCLIRFQDREFVVETADLSTLLAFAKAA
jgi:hypothetical protein